VLDSLHERLERLLARHEELQHLLAEPGVAGNSSRFRELSIELSEIEPVAAGYQALRRASAEREEARAMLADADPEVRAMAGEELPRLDAAVEAAEAALQQLLLPRDPNDNRSIFLEIRAGTGGDEAALFAGDLFRMYSMYAEQRGWGVEVMSASHGEHGGYKEIISRIAGNGAYSRLKFESGGHRVQRVPATESQGRIHTSACTVAVLPEAEEIDDVTINPAELRIDTFRASGAGGQHVNRTDSAVRITHLPTGIVVECQDDRSQHKNKARAMSVLRARILEREVSRQQAEEAATRRGLIGSGDRSERIRTYNFPQGRVTDHRIDLTLYRLAQTLEGDLDPLIDALSAEHQAEQLAALAPGSGERARH